MAGLEYFDGAQYQSVPGVPGPQALAQVSATAPTPRGVGDVWVNSTTPLLDGWDDDWRYPTLINGWSDYGGVYGGPRYRKMPGGLVVCQGLIKDGTIGSTAAPAFYIDEDCRTTGDALNFCSVAQTTTGRILIYQDGRFVILVGSTGWTSITCCWQAG